MSVVLIGIVTFGFFSATLSNFSENAEELTLETNLSDIVAEVGNKIIEMVSRAEKLKGTGFSGDSFALNIVFEVPESFSGLRYGIQVSIGSNNMVSLQGFEVGASSNILVTYELGIVNTDIAFSGRILSDTGGLPQVTYTYELGSATIQLSNK